MVTFLSTFFALSASVIKYDSEISVLDIAWATIPRGAINNLNERASKPTISEEKANINAKIGKCIPKVLINAAGVELQADNVEEGLVTGVDSTGLIIELSSNAFIINCLNSFNFRSKINA